MNETSNNVTRQGIYLGKTEDGSLYCLPASNVLIVGQNGRGFETLINSILCNQVYMSNPKDERIMLYHDNGSLCPSWHDLSPDCPVFESVYEEYPGSACVRFMEFISDLEYRMNKRILKLNEMGSLPEDDNHHITALIVLRRYVKQIETLPSWYALTRCLNNCKDKRQINMDIVVAVENHVPSDVSSYDWVCSTPLSNDDFSRVVMGSDFVSRSPWKYGVVFYKNRTIPGSLIIKLDVIYRPDTFIQKLLKSFKVKRSKGAKSKE